MFILELLFVVFPVYFTKALFVETVINILVLAVDALYIRRAITNWNVDQRPDKATKLVIKIVILVLCLFIHGINLMWIDQYFHWFG